MQVVRIAVVERDRGHPATDSPRDKRLHELAQRNDLKSVGATPPTVRRSGGLHAQRLRIAVRMRDAVIGQARLRWRSHPVGASLAASLSRQSVAPTSRSHSDAPLREAFLRQRAAWKSSVM
jgi:hypothetical protein